jgi:hypothetical protein
MSAKHNCKHVDRSRSNYPNRSGVYSHGHLAEIEGSTGLRHRQERRVELYGVPFPPMSELNEDEKAA